MAVDWFYVTEMLRKAIGSGDSKVGDLVYYGSDLGRIEKITHAHGITVMFRGYRAWNFHPSEVERVCRCCHQRKTSACASTASVGQRRMNL